jgi:stalled ribosome rescue protein Dom34
MSKSIAMWIDHKEARIFHIQPDKVDEATVLVAQHHVHQKHPKDPAAGKQHPEEMKRFFHDVGRALEGDEEILVVGPSTAKFEFLRFVHKHEHALEPRIVGLETVDHPSDRQLVAYARKYFDRSGQAS